MNNESYKNKIVIIGASGHGRVIADIAKLNGYEEIVFLDDDTEKVNCGEYKVVGTAEIAKNLNCPIAVAIGNSGIRESIMSGFDNMELPTLIHPSAVVSEDTVIGKGTVIMAGAVVNPGTVIGNGCIINTSSSVDHDCVIQDYCHVSVGAHLCGTVTIGKHVWIGAGSTVSNNIMICDNAFIGAGATVVHSIEKEGTYIGTPAKLMR